eukprot:scaffold537_cov180-Ochromonas_danica.AAC.33
MFNIIVLGCGLYFCNTNAMEWTELFNLFIVNPTVDCAGDNSNKRSSEGGRASGVEMEFR